MKYSLLLAFVMGNALAMGQEDRALLALEKVNKSYTCFLEELLPNPNCNVDKLINFNRNMLDSVKKSIALYIVTKKINELSGVDTKYTQLQKTLIALRMIEVHNANRRLKDYRTASKWADVCSFLFLASAGYNFNRMNYLWSAFSIGLATGFFMGSSNCKKKASCPKQPIPTIQEICENEPLCEGQKIFLDNSKQLEFSPIGFFKTYLEEESNAVFWLNALKKSTVPVTQVLEHSTNKLIYFKKLRKFAFQVRDVEGILEISQRIQESK